MAAPVKFNDKLKARFLELFREFGRINRAAEGCGIVPETVLDHRKKDPQFALAFENALEHYRDDLVIEARRRAIQGCERVRTVTREGEVITEVVYSDRLLEMFLKAHIPDLFGDRQKVDLTVTPGALVVPGMMGAEQWEETVSGARRNGTSRH